MTDWLLGAADQYTWPQIKPWVRSARESGFDGHITLIVYRGDVRTIAQHCVSYQVEVLHGATDSWFQPIQHEARGRDTQSHQMRFLHFWSLLNAPRSAADYVIATDVRDVIFQSNPSVWLRKGYQDPHSIIAPSEALTYENEPWGAENMRQGFGPMVWSFMHDQVIANVGTIAGTFPAMRDLFLTLYLMGENRYIPNDQSGFNVLLRTSLRSSMYFAPMRTGWAAQCGTTLDPTKLTTFKDKWVEAPPVVKDGMVCTLDGRLFALAHQWDRVSGLKEAVEARYA